MTMSISYSVVLNFEKVPYIWHTNIELALLHIMQDKNNKRINLEH